MNDSYDNTNAMLGGDDASATGGRPEASKAEGWPMSGKMDDAFAMEDPTATNKRRINQGTLLVGLVLLVAAAALGAMRMSGGTSPDPAATDVEIRIETALAQLGVRSSEISEQNGAKPAGDSEKVIAVFTSNPASQQVPLDRLQRNPFYMAGRDPEPQEAGPVTPVSNPADRERDRKLQKLRDELARLELSTVMDGRTPMALISGKVVSRGERIGSFTVVRIESRRVTLAADGNTYRLAMDGPGGKPLRD